MTTYGPWIGHNGDDNPVPGKMVEVCTAGGGSIDGPSDILDWTRHASRPIRAYRVEVEPIDVRITGWFSATEHEFWPDSIPQRCTHALVYDWIDGEPHNPRFERLHNDQDGGND